MTASLPSSPGHFEAGVSESRDASGQEGRDHRSRVLGRCLARLRRAPSSCCFRSYPAVHQHAGACPGRWKSEASLLSLESSHSAHPPAHYTLIGVDGDNVSAPVTSASYGPMFNFLAPSECRSSSDSLSSQYAGHFWRCSTTGGVERPAVLARRLSARGMYASAEEKADGDRRCDDSMAGLQQR